MRGERSGGVSRRGFVRGIAGLGLVTAGLPLLGGCDGPAPTAREAPPVRVYRIGWMVEGDPASESTPLNWPSPLDPLAQRFLDRLTELGYVEGRNLHWEWRRTTGADRLAAAAAELVALGVDLILVLAASQALRAAFQAPGSTPVVMGASTGDPVGEGYAQSLARPGGKVTGVTSGPPFAVIGAKRLEIFKEALPTLTRLGVLVDVHEENAITVDDALSRLTPNARALGLELVLEEVRALEELDGAFAAMARAGADGVWAVMRIRWTGGDTAPRIIADALLHRLPMYGVNRSWVDAGALVAYSVDIAAIFVSTAELVDKVLRGARPGDTRIENPEKYELTINLQTARTLGLTVPPAVIARATEVIQ